MARSEETGRTVHITPTSAGVGLKEALEQLAKDHGLKIRPLVAMIYSYAVANQGEFEDGLSKSARPKDGAHITSVVSASVAEQLTKWAKRRNTPRGHQCCFILEKALDQGVVPKIIRWAEDKNSKSGVHGTNS